MPGLGTSFGRGGATNFQQDLANSDCIVIEGSNMAECHPVGFQWVMEAKKRGATVIHIDPRFTRTSAVADLHVPLRAGTDIAFLGGLINYVLDNELDFREYVVAYTNAAAILREDFQDTEDLDGLFSGFDPEKRTLRRDDAGSTRGRRRSPRPASARPTSRAARRSATATGTAATAPGQRRRGHRRVDDEPAGVKKADQAPGRAGLGRHPRQAASATRRCSTRAASSRCSSGTTPATPPRWSPTSAASSRRCSSRSPRRSPRNSNRERTTAWVYSVGWTHHTVGVQYIRAAGVLQALLGNIGRPGGGILALRGHASIQGSTDIPTLFNILPGYIPMPHAAAAPVRSTSSAPRATTGSGSGATCAPTWSACSRRGGATRRRPENDFAFDYLPRLTGDHGTYSTVSDMIEGKVPGYFLVGREPGGGQRQRADAAVRAGQPRVARRPRPADDRVGHLLEDRPGDRDRRAGDRGHRHRGLLPARGHARGEGGHLHPDAAAAAVAAQGGRAAGRRPQRPVVLLPPRPPAEGEAGRLDRPAGPAAARPDLGLPDPRRARTSPSAEAVLREINGWDADGKALSTYTEMKPDGSTAGGCWIYTGVYADEVNQAARRKPGSEQDWVAAGVGLGVAGEPAHRSTTAPRPTPTASRGASARSTSTGTRTAGQSGPAPDVPDFEADQAAGLRAAGGRAWPRTALGGADPFVMQADGKAWLYVPAGLADGPMPTHYEPAESPVPNALYGAAGQPGARGDPRGVEPGQPVDVSEVYPYVFTTYRLTEHHTAGGMSRTLPYLSELQPEFFVEVSPQLAAERGPGERRLGDAGQRPDGDRGAGAGDRADAAAASSATAGSVHQIGVPYHWGEIGLSTGDSANDLFGVRHGPERAHPGVARSPPATSSRDGGRAGRSWWPSWRSTGSGPACSRAWCRSRRPRDRWRRT